MTLPPSFWSKTARTDCIVWVGAQNSKGYGCYAVNGVSQLAHRVAWEAERGPIPDGLTIDHSCRVRACVNTAHMELVSVAENIRRVPRPLNGASECRNGHQIASDADLYFRPNGSAECRECQRAAKRRHRDRNIGLGGAT